MRTANEPVKQVNIALSLLEPGRRDRGFARCMHEIIALRLAGCAVEPRFTDDEGAPLSRKEAMIEVVEAAVRELEQGRAAHARQTIASLAASRPRPAPNAGDPPARNEAGGRGAPVHDARSIVERQKALIADYPEEYVVLRGDRLVAHTPDKEEAFSRLEEAWDASDDPAPIVVPPLPQRGLGEPSLRGRAIPAPPRRRER